MEIKNQKTTDTTVTGYKRGVFVLVRKFPSGEDSYITFKYRTKTAQMLIGDFHLAIFNEVLFANWYLVNLEGELKKDNRSDFPAEGPFFIMEILDQATWDFVRKTVIVDGVAKDAVINPCEGDKNHRCPMMPPLNLDEYANFNKLKEMLAKHPDKHFNAEINNN